MSTSEAPNYTDAQVERLYSLYVEHGSEGMSNIMDIFNAEFSEDRNIRSIRGKVMTLKAKDEDGNDVRDENGEYVFIYTPLPKPEKSAAKDQGPTKQDLIGDLEKALSVESGAFSTLVHARKQGIEAVLKAVSKAA